MNLLEPLKATPVRQKNNYEIKMTWDAKSYPKGFFQLHITKLRDKLGLLKTAEGELIDSEEMGKELNEYFRSLFTQETQTEIPEGEHVFMGMRQKNKGCYYS